MPRTRLETPNYRLRQHHNGIWYIDWTEPGGPAKSRSTRQRDRRAAEIVLAGYGNRRPLPSAVKGPGVTARRFYQRIETTAYVLWRRAKYRARKMGREFDLTRENVEEILRASKGRCMLTGIPFDFARASLGARRPWAPSLDRIESNKGYTRDNCRIVCVVANVAMNAWGEPVLRRLLDGYAEWRERGFVNLQISESMAGQSRETWAKRL